MNAVLTWTGRRVPPASIGDEWARSRGVHYHVSADLFLPEAVCYGATADGLSLGRFNQSSSGRNAAHVACQRHANQIRDYLDGASSCRNSDDQARTAKRLRATHAALTLVLSSYQMTHRGSP